MVIVKNIFKNISHKVKALLPVALVMFLSACEDCSTIQDYISEGTGANCFFCPMYDLLTESATNIANIAWGRLAAALQPVVCIVSAIYIAGYTLKMVSSFGQQTAADYITADKKGILLLVFKTSVICLLLQDQFMINKIIAPLLEASGEVGLGLATVSGGDVSFSPSSVGLSKQTGWAGAFGMVNSIATHFNDEVYEIIGIGNALSCFGTDGFIWEWSFYSMIYGSIFTLFGWMVSIGICFYLVDIIINLAIAAVLLPLGIAFAISDKTTTYTKNIWNSFVNSFCSFMFIGMFLCIAVQLILLSIGGKDDYEVVHGWIAGNNVEAIADGLAKNSGMILLIVILSLLVSMAESIKKLASKIAGVAGFTDAGSKTMSPMAQMATNQGMKLAKATGKHTWNGTKYVGHVGARITRLDKLGKNVSNGFTAARGYLTGTGAQGYRAWWR